MYRFKYFFPLLLLLWIVATGCADKTVKIYQANIPIYEDLATWRATTPTMAAPTALENPGKIYIYNDLLIVNELMRGVHIYNNANPSAPIDLGFLPVHANADIAVRNNIMYLDSYTDLLAFDISDPSHPTYLSRVNGVFTFVNYYLLDGFDSQLPLTNIDESKGVVTGWKQDKTTEEVYSYNYGRDDIMMESLVSLSGLAPSAVGQAGSMARFALYDHYLYTLENWQLGVFDVSDGLLHATDIQLNRSSETLFPYGGRLFIGTTTGMLVYDLANPANPAYLSTFVHINSCDPVVVEGNLAYVTLRSGTTCGSVTNSLNVVDMTDITMPYLRAEYGLTNPHGLGVDGSALFICDGADGLKVYDKTDPSTISSHMIAQFTGITAADVIPHNQVLIMTSEQGIYQYSYADLQNITQLSLIPAVH